MSRHPIVDHLMNYLPSFCWMSAYEVLLMLEQIDEDVDYSAVKVALCRMSEGAVPRIEKLLIKIDYCIDRRGPLTEYIYRFNPAFERASSPRRGQQSHLAVIASIERSTPERLAQPRHKPHSVFSLSLDPVHNVAKSADVIVLASRTSVPCSPTA